MQGSPPGEFPAQKMVQHVYVDRDIKQSICFFFFLEKEEWVTDHLITMVPEVSTFVLHCTAGGFLFVCLSTCLCLVLFFRSG